MEKVLCCYFLMAAFLSPIQDIIQAMPHDAHPMGVLCSAMSAVSVFHLDANPALRVSHVEFLLKTLF